MQNKGPLPLPPFQFYPKSMASPDFLQKNELPPHPSDFQPGVTKLLFFSVRFEQKFKAFLNYKTFFFQFDSSKSLNYKTFIFFSVWFVHLGPVVGEGEAGIAVGFRGRGPVPGIEDPVQRWTLQNSRYVNCLMWSLIIWSLIMWSFDYWNHNTGLKDPVQGWTLQGSRYIA